MEGASARAHKLICPAKTHGKTSGNRGDFHGTILSVFSVFYLRNDRLNLR